MKSIPPDAIKEVRGDIHNIRSIEIYADFSLSNWVEEVTQFSSNRPPVLTTMGSLLTISNSPRMENSTTFPFLRLPVELRCLIYEEFLVVGKVFYTPNKHDIENGARCNDHHLYKVPQLSLLRVCKQIHEEAEEIYHSQNLFVLPVKIVEFEPFASRSELKAPAKQPRHLFSDTGLKNIRNVSIAFDAEQVEPFRNMQTFWKIFEKNSGISYLGLSRLDRMRKIHQHRMEEAGCQWEEVKDFLFEFTHKLEYLEIDCTNAFCPMGCCRSISNFVDPWWLDLAPEKSDVVGLSPSEQLSFAFYSTENKEEFEDMDMQATTEHLEKKHGLTFRAIGGPTKWDLWKM